MNFTMANNTNSNLCMNSPLELINDDISIGDTIKKAREAHKLTQKELATLSGISTVQLCRIENNEHVPSPKSLKALSCHIGLSYSLLLIKAGYNHAASQFEYYGKDGELLDSVSTLASIYYADPELLTLLNDILSFSSNENITVLKLLLQAMKKECDICKNNQNIPYFSKLFSSLKKFITESIMALIA